MKGMKTVSIKLSSAYKLASSISSIKKTMLPIRVSLPTSIMIPQVREVVITP